MADEEKKDASKMVKVIALGPIFDGKTFGRKIADPKGKNPFEMSQDQYDFYFAQKLVKKA